MDPRDRWLQAVPDEPRSGELGVHPAAPHLAHPAQRPADDPVCMSRSTYECLPGWRRIGLDWPGQIGVMRLTPGGRSLPTPVVLTDGPLFRLGRVTVTRSLRRELRKVGVTDLELQIHLSRHRGGDWGTLSLEDHLRNDLAVVRGGPILSSYGAEGVTVWIRTDADRLSTTILRGVDS